ncbi:hypothetical protein B0H13DRAFT_291965 [Mycena leptocephala]|nr:hypothetical protein B0H13DRAFT_291965 [Mycena leptocephala]
MGQTQAIIADCRYLSVTVMTTSVTTRRIYIIRRISFPLPKITETSSGFAAETDLDFSYGPSSALSSPESASELSASPPISIETIPSHVERREGRRRKGPEKMHRCEICFKEFPRPSAVKTHMNVHNNARPYTCGFPNCPKTFSVRSNARRHYRTHGERPPQRDSPVQFQAGFKFAELIDAPEQPLPPPLSLSQAPFRVRWVPPNTTALTKVTHPVKRHEKKWNSPENADDSHEATDASPHVFI